MKNCGLNEREVAMKNTIGNLHFLLFGSFLLVIGLFGVITWFDLAALFTGMFVGCTIARETGLKMQLSMIGFWLFGVILGSQVR